MRPRFHWNLGRRSLALGERTLIMGVLNVTPDSFSDGGRYRDPEAAIAHGLALLDEGADILDVGGESTRPGTPVDSPRSPDRQAAVSAQQELDRVLPVLEGLRRARASAILSIDTYKSTVARTALDAGAEIVNDVSGLTWGSDHNAEMASIVAASRCGLILMHTRGVPGQWRDLPPLRDPVGLVHQELAMRAAAALQAGIARESIVLDPGFGFGKKGAENYSLLAHFDTLHGLGYPLLAGLSRKSFLAHAIAERRPRLSGFRPEAILPGVSPDARDTATLAATVAAVLAGAHIVRVHAVRIALEAVTIADAILQAQP